MANIFGAARYLRQMLDKFGVVHLAVAAYNAGPGAVERAGGIPAMARRPDMSATSFAIGASRDRLEMAGAGSIVLRFRAGWFCSG
jgi:soluble lytic murein transglycosylase-like protein